MVLTIECRNPTEVDVQQIFIEMTVYMDKILADSQFEWTYWNICKVHCWQEIEDQYDSMGVEAMATTPFLQNNTINSDDFSCYHSVKCTDVSLD